MAFDYNFNIPILQPGELYKLYSSTGGPIVRLPSAVFDEQITYKTFWEAFVSRDDRIIRELDEENNIASADVVMALSAVYSYKLTASEAGLNFYVYGFDCVYKGDIFFVALGYFPVAGRHQSFFITVVPAKPQKFDYNIL